MAAHEKLSFQILRGTTDTNMLFDDLCNLLRFLSQKSIAEGYGGNKGRVFQNSLTIARRETTEADYWLFLSYELGYMSEETHRQGYGEVRSMLSSLISKLGATSDSWLLTSDCLLSALIRSMRD